MLLAAAVAGAATFAWGCLGILLIRSGAVDGVSPWIEGPIVLGLLALTGAAAGLVSRRYRDAVVSWAAAVTATTLIFQAAYVIDPDLPTGDTGFWGGVLYAAVFSFPFVAGGHVLSVAITRGDLQQAVARRDPLLGLLAVACVAGVIWGVAVAAAPRNQECRETSPAEVAAALDVESLPAELNGLQLDYTAVCDWDQSPGGSYSAVWGRSPRHEIQIVLSTGVPSGGPPYQFTDEGGPVTFSMSEAGNFTAVYAPDLASLRATVAALWPELSDQLEREVAHPSTPQPKATPATPTE